MVYVKIPKGDQILVYDPPINMVSFYKTTQSMNQKNLTEILQERFSDIIKINPWMAGRLVKDKVDGVKDMYLSFSESVENAAQYVVCHTNDALFEKKDWDSLCSELFGDETLSFPAYKCLNKDAKLCCLHVFENSSKTEAAILLSLNHVVGDGYTCYQIWRMLDANEPIWGLEPRKDGKFDDHVRAETSLPPLSDMSMMGYMWSTFKRGLSRKMRCKPAPIICVYKLNNEAIEQIKSKYNTDTRFVSTHDIVCSTFFPLCEDDNMSFAMNMRGRLSKVDKKLCGNYEVICPVSVGKQITPVDFRNNWKKLLTKRAPTPRVGFNMSTSWTTFYHQVELPGYSHVAHFPVFDLKSSMEMLGIPLTAEFFVCTFKLSLEETGVLFVAYSDIITEEFFEDCELLAGKFHLEK